MKCLAVALLLGVAGVCAADIYRSVGENGEASFSDVPTPGSTRVEMGTISSFTPPAPVTAEAQPEPDPPEEPELPPGYETLEISAPPNGATLRDNAGNVAVRLELSPILRRGDRLYLLLDGQERRVTGTDILLPNLDRGTHLLEAQVRDPEGEVIARSEAVEFHLQRFSRLLPAR